MVEDLGLEGLELRALAPGVQRLLRERLVLGSALQLHVAPAAGRGREHRVFRRHPAAPGVLQERRHLVLDAGGAEYPGVAPLD